MRRRRWRGAVAAAALVALVGCGGGGWGSTDVDGGPVAGEVVVFAAASLSDVFAELGDAFAAAHPGARATFNFAGSASLVAGVLDGAPAGVLATASTATMDEAVAAGAVDEPTVLARNVLALAVPAGNPAGVRSIADLARTERAVGVCAPEVPCGALARRVLAAAGVVVAPDTEEPDVRALLGKLAAGELDAGLVYATDVAATPAVEGLAVPEAAGLATDYPVALVHDAPNPAAAAAFVELVVGDEGRAALAAAGFVLP
jgi:molybdate transport system substrate-binding protein